MKPMTDRLNKVIGLQRIAFFVNMVISAILTVICAGALAIESFFLGFLVGVFLMWLFMKILNIIAMMYIQMKVYEGDTDALLKDASDALDAITNPQDQVIPRVVKIISKPTAPIGKFMDADIYEWMEVQDPSGSIQRFEFSGTVNLEKGETPPPGTLTFIPGIIYEPKTSG